MRQLLSNKSNRNRKSSQEQMNIVIIGHVDHGKSTLIGRLLADTDSLPKGKLDEVKERCARNARPFEYAFLLDALKDEQAQGITIDSARCFFRSQKREYIIIDAPGHIEFLKNMISGAARAEAALLVIDAREGVKENSRRHGYLLSMLGIKQVAVCVNKMDIVDFSQEIFQSIKQEYTGFLSQIGITPIDFIPVSAINGDNIVEASANMPWHKGSSVLDTIDGFTKETDNINKPFRFPVQDIYKFTEAGDNRRIIAGRIETGRIRTGDEVIFFPSEKKSRIATVERFNAPVQHESYCGQSTGFTLDQQVYIKPGELMCKTNEKPARVDSHLKANIFWMARQPMITDKRYKIKLAGARTPVWLRQIINVLDASDLTTDSNRQQIERHDVAECILETLKPIAFDTSHEQAQTSRFVIIDNYEIAGGGIILDSAKNVTNRIDERVELREKRWERSSITPEVRTSRYNQRSTLVLICSSAELEKENLAKALEENLFNDGRFVYYLGLSNSLLGIDNRIDINESGERDEYIRQLGEISHLFTDSGMILITTVSDLDDYEVDTIITLNKPNDCRIINIGPNRFNRTNVDLQIDNLNDMSEAIDRIKQLLTTKKYLIEYYL